jgi:diadenosine tetraphosphate (Ap4A) HIT family hydrolase
MTVKERESPSFPTRELLKQGLITGRVLDFGCGLGLDGKFLRDRGFEVTDYDPYYAPNYPSGQFETILCIYVLNVLLPEEQSYVLMAVSELLSKNGRAFFAVRRDIRHNGFRTHAKAKVKIYQCNVLLPYRSILKTDHCEIYEYRHLNQISPGAECPFCAPDPSRELITESATVYAMLDGYPVSPGHALVIPKQHIADYFDLPERTKAACWTVADRTRVLLSQRFHPDGFNVGINIGASAGQTIPHVHIHLIPRFSGDTEDPTGGVRRVIEGKGDYLKPGS